ncbi:hypothetical protein SBA1_20046 [Candidatus Sulfotelmatobacter kueseliae]|uniref:Uncharacterized protein n=1 Tax=Candidatus Sulfotelmatobacter kueseliae TaxID=2042962 RepID=A0A2U3KFE4_9BACT|nr:hypothetical protein SBA1_20046 [Candidatus Sulfotelmatobacter kueseliae]
MDPDGTCAKHKPDRKMAIIIICQYGILILFLHLTWKLVQRVSKMASAETWPLPSAAKAASIAVPDGTGKAVPFPKPILKQAGSVDILR